MIAAVPCVPFPYVIPSEAECRAEEVVWRGSVSPSSVGAPDRASHATRLAAAASPWDGTEETSRSLGSNFLRATCGLARNDIRRGPARRCVSERRPLRDLLSCSGTAAGMTGLLRSCPSARRHPTKGVRTVQSIHQWSGTRADCGRSSPWTTHDCIHITNHA